MNNQERDALNLFLQQMVQAQAGQKDSEAEALIKSAMEKQPDAAYLLVQRSMQFDILLQQAQTRMNEMQAEIDQLKKLTDKTPEKPAETSFLGDVHAWGRGPSASTASPTGSGISSGAVPSATATGPAPVNQTLRASAPPAGAPATSGATPAPAAPSSWGSGFLGSMATTAAGVVAGSFLYHGIQNMMGSNHNSVASQPVRDPVGGSDWNTGSGTFTDSGNVYTAYVDPDSDRDQVNSFDIDDDFDDSNSGYGDGE